VARGPCAFKQSDLTKAVRGVVAAGVSVAKVEVDKTGKIVVVVGEPSKSASQSPLDQWIADRARAT
jgi:hypothetical protein